MANGIKQRTFYIDGKVERFAGSLDDMWMHCDRCDMDFHELSLMAVDHLAHRCPLTKARIK